MKKVAIILSVASLALVASCGKNDVKVTQSGATTKIENVNTGVVTETTSGSTTVTTGDTNETVKVEMATGSVNVSEGGETVTVTAATGTSL